MTFREIRSARAGGIAAILIACFALAAPGLAKPGHGRGDGGHGGKGGQKGGKDGPKGGKGGKGQKGGKDSQNEQGGRRKAPPAPEAGPAKRASSHPIKANRDWRRYIQSPPGQTVRPVGIAGAGGDIFDPGAMVHGGATTFTYNPGDPPPQVILDFGKDVGGRPSFEVAGGTATAMNVTYSETLANLDADGAFADTPYLSANAPRTEDLPVSGPGTVSSPLIQGAQRYVRIALTTPGTLTLTGMSIAFSPPRRVNGHFISSDILLNRIWYAGAYTVNLNQMVPGTPVNGGVNNLNLLLDGAKRDRAVWSGDHLISDLTNYYMGDPVYSRDSLSLFLEHPATLAWQFLPASGDLAQPGPLPGACSPNPNLIGHGCITWSATYSMAVIPALYNYFLYSGDRDFVRRHWQAVVRQMDWNAQHIGPDGLYVVDSTDDASWNQEHVSGRLTYVNAMYSLALQSAAKLATALGDRAHAGGWARRAESVNDAVNRLLWNPTTGVYDGSVEQRGPLVQDANVTAILAGIPDSTRARSLLKVLGVGLATLYGPRTVSDPTPPGYTQVISPYMGGFHVMALFASHEGASALSMIRQEWGYMISHDPGGVMWERIQLNGRPVGGLLADNMSHAWSTGPTAAMSQYLVGVTPTAPGYKRWSITPRPGDLSFAQGVVPTRYGPITVRWERKGRKRFVLTTNAPPKTSGTVAMPFGSEGTIARNGRVIWSRGAPVGKTKAQLVEGSVVFQENGKRATYAWAKPQKKKDKKKKKKKKKQKRPPRKKQ